MKLIRPQPPCEVIDVPVYNIIRLARSSTEKLNSPNAMEFSRKSGGFLQSLGHSIVGLIAFYEDDKATGRGLDGSADYQKTSTVNIKYFDEIRWYSAFTELPDEKASFELAKAGYEAHRSDRELVMPRNDPLVAKLIRSAMEAGRVSPLFKTKSLKSSTKQTGKRSEYGSNPDIIAVIGHAEITELYASYMQKKGRKTGFLNDLTESEIEKKMKGREDQALIRPVDLGVVYFDFGFIYAINNFSIGANAKFNYGGLARGIVPLETKADVHNC
ncbi:MAG: hypothetical protein NTW67_01085 [Candidatus Woesearchaeota archaeon]|nr:hypothetical protein [Candidatus Woesearchaeota archaeon]